ncbi:MAG TPA: VOC family protein [Saprospiraceae bacterium]|nr:VOC family protein [Saprospiraceae bacterium]
MATINVYLTFNGECEKVFEFYKSIFGGEFSYKGTFGEMPPSDEFEISEEDRNRIMHVSLPISKETVLMGSDTTSQFGHVTVGNNFSISLNVDSRTEADKFFAALSKGGKITMPIGDTFWGSYFGSLEDQFGINWMVSFDTSSSGGA